MRIQCPECKKILKVKKELEGKIEGKKAKCPKCGKRFVIPISKPSTSSQEEEHKRKVNEIKDKRKENLAPIKVPTQETLPAGKKPIEEDPDNSSLTGREDIHNNSYISVDFIGTGLQLIGWSFVVITLNLLVIPAAWGYVALYRWFIRNVSFSDGTTASFEGRGRDIWGYFIVVALILLFSQLLNMLGAAAVSILINFLLFPFSAFIWLQITRWLFANIKLSCGTQLSFKGTYGAFLVWGLFISLSCLTIIGWPWALVAMYRWICRKVEGGQNIVIFTGSGWGLLWRIFITFFSTILIIPLPWMVVWIIRWYTRNLIIKRLTE